MLVEHGFSMLDSEPYLMAATILAILVVVCVGQLFLHQVYLIATSSSMLDNSKFKDNNPFGVIKRVQGKIVESRWMHRLFGIRQTK